MELHEDLLATLGLRLITRLSASRVWDYPRPSRTRRDSFAAGRSGGSRARRTCRPWMRSTSTARSPSSASSPTWPASSTIATAKQSSVRASWGLSRRARTHAADAWHHIEAAIDGRLNSCVTPLRRVLPGCSDDELSSLGRSLRRTFYSALVDRSVSPDEMRGEMLSLIRGWPARSASRGPRRLLILAPTQTCGHRVKTKDRNSLLSLGQMRFRVLVRTHRSRFGRG
jgi:hypothetical protein